MFAAFWGEQQAAVAVVAAACIFLRWAGLEDLTVSNEAG
jgi:hypothetical protein